jgi:hypothetical protein
MSPVTGPAGQPAEPAPVRPSDGSAHLPPWSPEPDPTAFPPAPPEPAPEPAPAVVVPPAPPPANGGSCHGSSQCRRLIALGAVAGGLGLGTIVAGAVLASWRPEVDPDDPTTVLTYRPPGAAILAIGSGLVATSLLTLLAARRASQQALRRQRRAAAPSLEAAP